MDVSWIVYKCSEGILPQHPVNWPSLGLFGLEPQCSLISVNTNERLICSVLYLELLRRTLRSAPTQLCCLFVCLFVCLFFQNSNLTYGQPFLQRFSYSTYSTRRTTFPQFGSRSYGLRFLPNIQSTQLLRAGRKSRQWLTDSNIVYSLKGLSLPSRKFFSALCLIMLPCYQSSQSDQLVVYVYHHPFLMLCGDRCQWLCWKSSTSSSVLLTLRRGRLSWLAAIVATERMSYRAKASEGCANFFCSIGIKVDQWLWAGKTSFCVSFFLIFLPSLQNINTGSFLLLLMSIYSNKHRHSLSVQRNEFVCFSSLRLSSPPFWFKKRCVLE